MNGGVDRSEYDRLHVLLPSHCDGFELAYELSYDRLLDCDVPHADGFKLAYELSYE